MQTAFQDYRARKIVNVHKHIDGPRLWGKCSESIAELYDARGEAGLRELSGIGKSLAGQIAAWSRENRAGDKEEVQHEG
jgi:hypothetical protein